MYKRQEGKNQQGLDKNNNNVIVKVNEDFYRPAEVDTLIGDSSKANKVLNWKPECSFDNLVEMMVKEDLDGLENK